MYNKMAKQLIITIEDDNKAAEIVSNICEAQNFGGSIRNPDFNEEFVPDSETNPRRIFMSDKSFVLWYFKKAFTSIIKNSKKKIQHKNIDLEVDSISISIDLK